MISVLDALRYRLGDLGEPSLDPGFRAQQQPLPQGLPLVVQDAIRNQPSWGEGGVIPGPRNPLMEQEAATGVFAGPQREAPLANDIGVADFIKRQDIWPMAEDALPWRPSQLPRFASPLNQMMQRRGPFALY